MLPTQCGTLLGHKGGWNSAICNYVDGPSDDFESESLSHSIMFDSLQPHFAKAWALAHQAPVFMEFSREEYRNGLPCPSPGNLPDPGVEPGSPTFQADALPLSHLGSHRDDLTN